MSNQSAGVGDAAFSYFLFPVLIQEVRIFPKLLVTYYSFNGQTFISKGGGNHHSWPDGAQYVPVISYRLISCL